MTCRSASARGVSSVIVCASAKIPWGLHKVWLSFFEHENCPSRARRLFSAKFVALKLDALQNALQRVQLREGRPVGDMLALPESARIAARRQLGGFQPGRWLGIVAPPGHHPAEFGA